MENRRTLTGVNMTNFFHRELFMYSLGDIKFKKPISLKKMAYTTAGFILWSLPIFLIGGLKFNPLYLAIVLAPPLLVGHYATKPVFGGKTLIPFVKSLVTFVFQPKGWTDLRNNNQMGKEVLYVEQEIWISRRRELQYLAELKEKEKRAAKAKGKTK